MISYVWTVSGLLVRIVVSDAHVREVRPGRSCLVAAFPLLRRSSLIGEVAFWHLADVGVLPDVRFAPEAVVEHTDRSERCGDRPRRRPLPSFLDRSKLHARNRDIR